VNNAAVQQVHAGMKYHKCHRCVVVTNSCFTSSAVELATRVNCTLIDGANLKSLILGHIRL
jgi:HJR/Mrr/RecB family endonuclease